MIAINHPVNATDQLARERGRQEASRMAANWLRLVGAELGRAVEVDAVRDAFRGDERRAYDDADTRLRQLRASLLDTAASQEPADGDLLLDVARRIDRLIGVVVEEAVHRAAVERLRAIADDLRALPSVPRAILGALENERRLTARRAEEAASDAHEAERRLARSLDDLALYTQDPVDARATEASYSAAHILRLLAEARGREAWGSVASRLTGAIRGDIARTSWAASPGGTALHERLGAWARAAEAEADAAAVEAARLGDLLPEPLAVLGLRSPD